jgi:hypothetical protein
MKTNGAKSLPLWDEFQRAAKSRKRNPERLLTDFMRECLESWEDEQLFREMQRQARKSGLKSKDAVNFVRQVRKEMRARRGTS